MNSSASWAKMVYLHHSFVHSFIHLCCITDITARPRPSRHAITGYCTALLVPCNNSWFRPHDNASGHSKIVTLRGGGQSQCHRVWQGKVGGRSLSRLRHAVFTQASDAELPLISFGLLYLIYQVVSFVGQCLYCMGFLEESCVVFWVDFEQLTAAHRYILSSRQYLRSSLTTLEGLDCTLVLLTLSSPVMPTSYISKCSGHTGLIHPF